MPQEIAFNTEARRIANLLIDAHHTHLHDVVIFHLFTSATGKSKGREVLATTKSLGPLEVFLVDDDTPALPHFAILYRSGAWMRLNDRQRQALVDRQLCGITVEEADDGDQTWRLVGPDWDGYTDNYRRFGAWEADLQAMAAAVTQPRLPLDDLPQPLPLVDAVADGLHANGVPSTIETAPDGRKILHIPANAWPRAAAGIPDETLEREDEARDDDEPAGMASAAADRIADGDAEEDLGAIDELELSDYPRG